VFEDSAAYASYRANLSDAARHYLAEIGVRNPDRDAETAGLIWMHALAVGYSPDYLNENADGIRQDWPRIPLPASKKSLRASAALGRRVAALLDVERPVPGVTASALDRRLGALGGVGRVGGGSLNLDVGELDITAGWGFKSLSKRGDHVTEIVQPGKGRLRLRPRNGAEGDEAFGDESLDVYLNEIADWSNVPQPVWEFTIGGYQVIKKWLSYRERIILGRGLTMEEADRVTEIIRRIAALVLMQPELDANYQAVKAAVYPWPSD
jgi:hypothetical protein